ncbi:hypothetical protein [Arachidicoccus terrestris]|uniref:hypothetical protein n=1 Tax=Arachidicoccus terrestris TaxID=2875539 RepID=UPI001CC73BE2|nr:hypothetical protein [Arachidicoccus terrestris]UAY54639.1 hypothetical protein K9M52_14470 [Arachidicoccus terrestris]
MRKVFYCCLLSAGLLLTACQNRIAEFKDFKDQMKESLWHSVLDQVNVESADTAAVEAPRPLNYFLREGFAAKFGL